MKIPFSGHVLILGCGSVSQCVQPLILRHFEMDFSRLTILDFEDRRHLIPETLAAGRAMCKIACGLTICPRCWDNMSDRVTC